MFNKLFFFLHYVVNTWVIKACLELLIVQLSCTRKMRDIVLKDGARIPGQVRISNCQGLSVAGPITAPAKAPAGRRDQQVQSQSSPQLLGPGNGHICEVTAASEKWGRGEGKDKHSFPSHFSLAAENWQSQLFLFSLPPSPVVLLMLLNRLEPVLCSLVPVRIWSTVLG